MAEDWGWGLPGSVREFGQMGIIEMVARPSQHLSGDHLQDDWPAIFGTAVAPIIGAS